jgi:hypothetical protein
VKNRYVPPFAPHVQGAYEDRPTEDELGPGEAPEQPWRAVCDKCGAETRGVCVSGAVRTHINRFAALHLHRDPLG